MKISEKMHNRRYVAVFYHFQFQVEIGQYPYKITCITHVILGRIYIFILENIIKSLVTI